MKALASESRTISVSSHLMSEMAQTADHLIVIGRGRLIADVGTAEFIARVSTNHVRVRSPQQSELASLIGSRGIAAEQAIAIRRGRAGDRGDAVTTQTATASAIPRQGYERCSLGGLIVASALGKTSASRPSSHFTAYGGEPSGFRTAVITPYRSGSPTRFPRTIIRSPTVAFMESSFTRYSHPNPSVTRTQAAREPTEPGP
jgi:hypothetical protein